MSQLDRRSEAQLLNLFPKPVKLGLLYKGRFHGYEYNTLLNKLGGEGKCVIIIYLASGPVRGVYLSEALSALTSDNDAFLFDVSENGATKYPVLEPSKASVVSYEANLWQFGDSIKMTRYDLRHVSFCARDCVYTSTGWPTKNSQPCEIELHRVHDLGHLLPNDWRHLSWTASARDDLMRDVVSFQALDKDLPRIRVLLLGPAGAGKSSFVVSARSIMYNRVVHLPIIGKAAGGFTKRLMSYEIRAEKGGCPTALSLCDAMSVGDGCSVGLCLSDALAVVKGHVPEGYKFQSEAPISDKVKGYRAAPSLKEQVHCILFVLSASEVGSYPDSLGSALRELHCEVSDLCVPQLILLTHIDEVCHAVHEDVKYVYSSRTLQDTIEKAAELVQMPVSSVMPVKNYTSEHSVTCNVDILLLDAIRHVLNAVDDMLEDQFPAANETFKVEPLKPL